MTAGDITATITECSGTAAIKTYLDTETTGASVVASDKNSFDVIPDPDRPGIFWVVKIARAQS